MSTTLSNPETRRSWLRSATLQLGIWCASRFGIEAYTNRRERAARVLEEAIELAQAEGLPIGKAQRILEVVYSKPAGEPSQEAAGVMTTLMGWAASTSHDLERVTQAEIDRIHALPKDYFEKKKEEKRALGVSEENPGTTTAKERAFEPA